MPDPEAPAPPRGDGGARHSRLVLRGAFLLLGLGALALASVVLSFLLRTRPPAAQTFDSVRWRAEEPVRESMIDDLLARGLLDHMKRTEVEAFLGAPDERTGSRVWRYYFGLISFVELEFASEGADGRVLAVTRGEK